ncbi:MAG: hypothetical protein F6K26_56345 [Moorea sp. SIO2I5]|nr:hypothetical protein [Moorena sp. SIO2I5]
MQRDLGGFPHERLHQDGNREQGKVGKRLDNFFQLPTLPKLPAPPPQTSRAPAPHSRLPTPDSRFPIPCSLFPVPCSLKPNN